MAPVATYTVWVGRILVSPFSRRHTAHKGVDFCLRFGDDPVALDREDVVLGAQLSLH